MDVLRNTGRAELASFLGGSNAGRRRPAQWQFAPYTEADLEKQLRERRSSTGRKANRRSKT